MVAVVAVQVAGLEVVVAQEIIVVVVAQVIVVARPEKQLRNICFCYPFIPLIVKLPPLR